jgi:hypothetical protein
MKIAEVPNWMMMMGIVFSFFFCSVAAGRAGAEEPFLRNGSQMWGIQSLSGTA